ncbi:hypothetical protein ACFQ0O_36270 [Saccharopolyspora spinosporotrichia]
MTTPAQQPSDGAVLLDELHATLTKFVILPSPQAIDAVVLWIAATHAQPAWAHAPAWSSAPPRSAAASPDCSTSSKAPATSRS